MSKLQILTSQRDDLLKQIREIEEYCEGIENENDVKRVQELYLEYAKLNAQNTKIQANFSMIQTKLIQVGTEIVELSRKGVDRILEAINNQLWYFFANKQMIIFDKKTGLLWPNVYYYNIGYEKYYWPSDASSSFLEDLSIDGFSEWKLPSISEVKEAFGDGDFPFYQQDLEGNWAIFNRVYYPFYFVKVADEDGKSLCIGNYVEELKLGTDNCGILPCDRTLTKNNYYVNNVKDGKPTYTETERLQFILNLFIENDLWPIFADDEIKELYKKIYFDKRKLLTELQELQEITLLSSGFDYEILLENYDLLSIDNSIIKYYKAVQKWTDELIDKLGYYETEMNGVIRDFNLISLKLSKKYEDSKDLTEEENQLLSERQKYFQKNFSLGMTSVKEKLLSIKKQADDLEYRIEEINNGDDAIHQLALLEKEERASFKFLAENTAMFIKNALFKIEYFQENHQFVINAIDIWEKWTDDYRAFRTTYKEDLRDSCEEDGIEEDIWRQWYEDWQSLRFKIEQKIQPMIERGLKSVIPMVEDKEISVAEQVIRILENYKNEVDRFFLEERKGIYQKFVFQAGGNLQDKIETESELYKRTVAFQTQLQEVIFNCNHTEDRIYILKWANDLLDFQIDEILSFVADRDLEKISESILTDFSNLKKKNYEVYLMDAEAYGKEKSRREKEYNSLVFKMRKDLMK